MPPRGWRKNKVEVPKECPNCQHDVGIHRGGSCFQCTCHGWLVLPAKNEWKLPGGWYEWGKSGPKVSA
jgi:hypothetical protein